MLLNNPIIYSVIELLIYLTGVMVVMASLIATTCWAFGKIIRSIKSFVGSIKKPSN